jgi:shikimate dehydrogenase
MVSRAGGPGLLTYEKLTPEIIEDHKLIVNTTPLGTFPAVEEKPDLPYEAIGKGHYLYDLVYNPPVTAFLAEGARRGARVLNGETMFRAQAERNWEIWNDFKFSKL